MNTTANAPVRSTLHQRLELHPPRKILVVNVTRIGDTLLVTPAVRALARKWPDAHITVLAHPKRKEVLEALPFVGHIGAIEKHRAQWLGWLGGKTYDLAFVFGFDEALVKYALRASRDVVAFQQASRSLNERLALAVTPPARESLHAVMQQLALVMAAGVEPAGYGLAYQVTAADRDWAQARLRSDVGAARPLVGLQIASFPTRAYRNWPVTHFAELCHGIRATWPDAHFLVFGGKADADATADLGSALTSHATVYAGQLTLRQTAALMNELDLYVGVDTGPTHIAGAVGCPMVSLYHCRHPASIYAPLDRAACIAIDHPAAGTADCGPQTPMADIPPARVLAACSALLNGTSAGSNGNATP